MIWLTGYRVAIYSAGAGGNYILDATNLIEFLPASHYWLVTFMAVSCKHETQLTSLVSDCPFAYVELGMVGCWICHNWFPSLGLYEQLFLRS